MNIERIYDVMHNFISQIVKINNILHCITTDALQEFATANLLGFLCYKSNLPISFVLLPHLY